MADPGSGVLGRVSRSGWRRRAVPGPLLLPGQHPMSLVEPPPRHAPFILSGPSIVTRANGMPVIVVSGECPDLAALDGFVLLLTTRKRQLVFGGMHPLIRDGADAPFRFFFEFHGAGPEVHGILEAVMHVDVVVSRPSGQIESFVFRYLRWDTIMNPTSFASVSDVGSIDGA